MILQCHPMYNLGSADLYPSWTTRARDEVAFTSPKPLCNLT